jgi:hypothetical protein
MVHHEVSGPGYDRDESRAHQLDRNWAELLQELRVIGTGVQILFAFLLGIAFQARFSEASSLQRDLYLVILTLSGLAAALLIAPVAMHRLLFRIGVKDELVTLSNRLAVGGLAVLSVSMVGAVVLTTVGRRGSGGSHLRWAHGAPVRCRVVRVAAVVSTKRPYPRLSGEEVTPITYCPIKANRVSLSDAF